MRAGGAILRAFVEKILVKIPDISIIHSKRGDPLHHCIVYDIFPRAAALSFIQLVRIGFLGLYHSIRYLAPPPSLHFFTPTTFFSGSG